MEEYRPVPAHLFERHFVRPREPHPTLVGVVLPVELEYHLSLGQCRVPRPTRFLVPTPPVGTGYRTPGTQVWSSIFTDIARDDGTSHVFVRSCSRWRGHPTRGSPVVPRTSWLRVGSGRVGSLRSLGQADVSTKGGVYRPVLETL